MSKYGYIKHDEMSGYAIAHHGIKGQKWGIRRYQNADGTLTEAGKLRYSNQVLTSFEKAGKRTKYGTKVYDNDKLNQLSRDLAKDILDNRNYDKLKKISNEFKELRKQPREDFDQSKEYNDAYKKAVQEANKEIKSKPNDYPKEQYFPKSKYFDRLVDYYFYDKGIYDKAESEWKKKSKSNMSKKLDKSYDELYNEASKIVNDVLNSNISSKKINSLPIDYYLRSSIINLMLNN